ILFAISGPCEPNADSSLKTSSVGRRDGSNPTTCVFNSFSISLYWSLSEGWAVLKRVGSGLTFPSLKIGCGRTGVVCFFMGRIVVEFTAVRSPVSGIVDFFAAAQTLDLAGASRQCCGG